MLYARALPGMTSFVLAMAFLCLLIACIVIQTYRRRLDAISMPFLIGCMFAYLYVLVPLRLVSDGSAFDFLTEQQVAKAVWVPAFMLAALWGGWQLAAGWSRTASLAGSQVSFDPRRVYRAGLVLTAFGAFLWLCFLRFSGGAVHFYSHVHGGAGRWEATTAYLYNGLTYVYPGLAFMIFGNLHRNGRSRWRWLVPCAVVFFVFAHAMLMGSRSAIFRLVGCSTACFFLATRKRPPVTVALGGGVLLAALILALISYRAYTPIGRWRYLSDVSPGAGFDYATRAGTGNEFLLHSGAVATVDVTGKLGYGEGYLWYHLIHPIPRLLWPGKPYGVATGRITKQDMVQSLGWGPATGSASGLVAGWYREWGIFSFLVWALLGLTCGSIYSMARAVHPSPWWVLVYSLMVSGSLNMIAQGFTAFWEPFLLQIALSYLLWRVYVRQGPAANRGVQLTGARSLAGR